MLNRQPCALYSRLHDADDHSPVHEEDGEVWDYAEEGVLPGMRQLEDTSMVLLLVFQLKFKL